MKKFNVSAVVLAAISAVLLLAAALMVLIDKNVSSANVVVFVALLAVAVVFMVLVFKLNGNKIAMMVPVLALVVLGKYLLDQYNGGTTYQLLALVVLALYVVALVFALTKNAKWAAITVLVVTVLFAVQFVKPVFTSYKNVDAAIYALADAKKYNLGLDAAKADLFGYASVFAMYLATLVFASGVAVYAASLVATKNNDKAEEATSTNE